MREIKFRGMTINGEWHYGLLAHFEKKVLYYEPGWYISNSVGMPVAYQVRPETIGQFINKHDKNGKEIYEGDIINGREKIVVEFEGGGFYPFAIPGWEGSLDAEDVEIIGNIHENKELLKG